MKLMATVSVRLHGIVYLRRSVLTYENECISVGRGGRKDKMEYPLWSGQISGFPRKSKQSNLLTATGMNISITFRSKWQWSVWILWSMVNEKHTRATNNCPQTLPNGGFFVNSTLRNYQCRDRAEYTAEWDGTLPPPFAFILAVLTQKLCANSSSLPDSNLCAITRWAGYILLLLGSEFLRYSWARFGLEATFWWVRWSRHNTRVGPTSKDGIREQK